MFGFDVHVPLRMNNESLEARLLLLVSVYYHRFYRLRTKGQMGAPGEKDSIKKDLKQEGRSVRGNPPIEKQSKTSQKQPAHTVV